MTRQAASPAPIASAGPRMTIVTGPTMFFRSGTNSPTDVNVKLVSECADGTQINPRYLVFEGTGDVMTVPFTPVERGWGWLTVSCATPTIRVPRIDRGR